VLVTFVILEGQGRARNISEKCKI